ncbi:MAG: hypothetical protein GXY44_03010 [Phycisphaerales bacterium]|nr:hypothetical protein [Phycisphaerales bacterium]
MFKTLSSIVLLCCPLVAVALDGVEPIGWSMPAMARGGADVAVGDTALSQIENPATLTLNPDQLCRFDAAGQLFMPDTQWDGLLGSAQSSVRHVPFGHAGLVIPVNERIGLGLALYSKSQFRTRYRMRHLLSPWTARRVGADLYDMALALNVGYKVNEKLSLGVGGRAELVTAEFKTVSGPTAVDFDRGYTIGGGFQLGALYELTPTLTAGLGYRSRTWLHDIAGRDRRTLYQSVSWLKNYGIPTIRLVNADIADMMLPQRVAGGLAWDATDRLKLFGEVRWINYSDSVLHKAKFLVGRGGLTFRSPIGYHDQWVMIAGAEYKLDEHWIIAGGYHYATNPVARKEMNPLSIHIVEHQITTGLRYQKDNWWAGVGYILGLPASLSRTGTTAIPLGLDYMAIEVRQMQHSVTCGFGFSW